MPSQGKLKGEMRVPVVIGERCLLLSDCFPLRHQAVKM